MKTKLTLMLSLTLLVTFVITACDKAETATITVPVNASWTNVGDDNYEGFATRLEFRVAKTSDSLLTNWGSCMLVPNWPAPDSAGVRQSFQFDLVLETEATYYMAIRAYDNQNNAGPVSNVVEKAIPDDIPPGGEFELTVDFQ